MMICHLNEDGLRELDIMIQMNIKPEWFNDDIIRNAMKDIEHVYKIEGLAFYSSDFGVKSPESLSNGMKALLLLSYMPEDYWIKCGWHVANTSIGDNVTTFLRQLSLKKDFHIAYDIWLPFQDNMPIMAKDNNTGITFTNTSEIMEFYAGRCTI